MKTTAIALIATFSICLIASEGSPKLEFEKKGVINQQITIGILNLTVVRIDPNGKDVQVSWKGFNVRSGDAFHVPFEIIELKSGDEAYIISSQSTGNNNLEINGKNYSFKSREQQILIKFGEGINIEDGGSYQDELKNYEITPKHFKTEAEPKAGENASRPTP